MKGNRDLDKLARLVAMCFILIGIVGALCLIYGILLRWEWDTDTIVGVSCLGGGLLGLGVLFLGFCADRKD
jgi:hypothetical protein